MSDKCIVIRWYVSDVLEIRPDLTEMQAWEVLETIFNSALLREHGVNLDVISDTASTLFPET